MLKSKKVRLHRFNQGVRKLFFFFTASIKVLFRKGDDFHKPSNTPPPQLEETAVDKPPAGTEAGEAEKKVPLTLYNSIKQAVASRAVWEANRNKLSKSAFVFDENFVQRVADSYKRKSLLPKSWEYNPAIASTYEPKDDFPSMQRLNGKPIRSDNGSYVYICSMNPRLNLFPMEDYETRSWLEFKKLDELNFSKVRGGRCPLYFPLSIKHPFINVIGDFAVNGFNEMFEMYVEKGNHNRLSSVTFKKCKYDRGDGSYIFTITLSGDEDGFRGIYRALVSCTVKDCKKTLESIKLTDIKHGKVIRASKDKSLPAANVGLWLPNIQGTGMCRRASTYGGGYDYRHPDDITGYIP